jgi:lipoprotein-anchoring transpeptidase ErfK/SrfK
MSHGYRYVIGVLVLVLLLGPSAAAGAPPDQGGTYTVQRGDTLAKIAARMGVSVADLVQINGLGNTNYVYIGQRLMAPSAGSPASAAVTNDVVATSALGGALAADPAAVAASDAASTDATAADATAAANGTYIVRPGDTLAKIAARYRTTIATLMRLNRIKNANRIYVGQRLIVPGATGTTPKPNPNPSPSASGKWIDVSIGQQRLTAYEGQTVVFSALISSGVAGHRTPIGRFAIRTKLSAQTMSGPGYWLPNVPWVMYFAGANAIHGTYWHHNFGHPMSHGCINMTTADASWMYHWASIGTPVVVHG